MIERLGFTAAPMVRAQGDFPCLDPSSGCRAGSGKTRKTDGISRSMTSCDIWMIRKKKGTGDETWDKACERRIDRSDIGDRRELTADSRKAGSRKHLCDLVLVGSRGNKHGPRDP
jgi:hypothetical protein